VSAHYNRGPVSPEEARTEDCPLCLAAKGQPCVSLLDKFEYEQPPGWRSWGAPKKLVRAKGTPFPDYCHPQRRSVARERFRRVEYQRSRKEALARLHGPSAGALAARAAMLAWDAAEYRALTSWWREHGHIIVNAGKAKPS
jgi:hypothetical protein